ncbi:hypothetical protein FGU71_12575, partial [Erythrobacter insulae]
MKSLFINTATAAVAISLASTASASEAQPYVAPELDTMLFAESPSVAASFESDASASETIAAANVLPVTLGPVDPEFTGPISVQESTQASIMTAAAPQALIDAATRFDAPVGIVTLASSGTVSSDAVPANFADYAQSLSGGGAITARSIASNDVDAYYGDIDAFWGDIVAFYGDISPFWGDISPFYGDISPFWGDISPFWGDISPFWGDIDAFWGDIVAFDQANLQSIAQFGQNYSSQITTIENEFNSIRYNLDGSIIRDGAPDKMMAAFAQLISIGEAQYGSKYTAKTGQDFDQLVNEVFARHGADANNKASIEALTKGQRARLYLDFHDTLNQYSGIDHVDHWMSTVNWTPSISQIQGSGVQTIVGVIDSAFGSSADLNDNLVYQGGYNDQLEGHGSSVTSLIVGAHDGEGVMGIAPNARVAAYNPFMVGGSPEWYDVMLGIWSIKGRSFLNTITGDPQRASVINLSLGEAGYVVSPGLAAALDWSWVKPFANSTVYVIAAGNDGISQTQDVNWGYTDTAALLDSDYTSQQSLLLGFPTGTVSESTTAAIFVGSVRPDGTISDFSNRPGDACLLNNGVCNSGNELMNRFIVAPGELLLADDGHGGLIRRSGTSFAAPLVSGAIALLHDRWPWLANNPHETADIIFQSAQDLGAPGVDAVYGHGLLDVAASQSPLDFGNLSYTFYERKGKSYRSYETTASQLLGSGVPSYWETSDVYLTAFEDIGGTFRDFAIPMSSFTYGKSTNALGNGYQRMQDFVSDRFANWLLSNGADRDGDGKHGISQIRSNSAGTDGQWSMRFDAIAPQFSDDGAMRPVHNAATLADPSGTMSFTLGHGQGALALAGNNFGIISDHDHETGGVNPVLGLASGETFAGATYSPLKATTLSVGYSQQREDWRDLDGVSEIERNIQRQLGAREAEALTIGVEQKVTKNLSVNAQYTYLREEDAVLGAQTGSAALLGEGS